MKQISPEQEPVWNEKFENNLMRYSQAFARVKDTLQYITNIDSETIRIITDNIIEQTDGEF